MNEQQARNRGYSFSGCYEWSKEKLAEKLESYKDEGYKAVIVTVPDSKYSRGIPETGYAIYIEHKFFSTREKKDLSERLRLIENRKSLALKEYQKQLKDIDNEANKMKTRLSELG